MNIVVLDGFTLNPGDLTWQELEALGELRVYDRTPGELTVRRAKGAEIVLTNKVTLDRPVIESLPDLKYIGVLATGYDVVDLEAANEHGITVTNVPTYGTQSVAQMVFAHLLNLTQHVAHHAETVRQGRWATSPDWCYWDYPLIELAGLVMGVLGFGRIGQNTAKIALAFDMKVIAYDPFVKDSPMESVTMVDLDTLFRQSDVISVHTPLTAETEGMVNAELLRKMKKEAFIINTSRGAVINEQDLATALNEGWIAGAGLDVLSEEPPAMDNPLLRAPNVYITPHISWATRSARARLMKIAIENVRAFLQGQPQNVVNVPANKIIC